MAPMLMEQASDLRDFVGSVLELQDPVGVLSVTIGIEPGAASGGTPPWEIALENDLTRLRHDGSLGPASKRRLEEMSARLAELLDPTSAGRGSRVVRRARIGRIRQLALQRALPTGARVGPVAHVLPLLEALGAVPIATLRPEPIPLDLKVVLLGSPLLYYLLYQLDEDFRELFKVKADFSPELDWTSEHHRNYAAFVIRSYRPATSTSRSARRSSARTCSRSGSASSSKTARS